ncbi:hypothetical protein BaRGS_00033567 [Batillaria attramentaria]|uniref:Secreted protein n=1 Tax=Batillaria attramentaria TaxID=370345 RepID=A0ABD0JJQ7_9CAEN
MVVWLLTRALRGAGLSMNCHSPSSVPRQSGSQLPVMPRVPPQTSLQSNDCCLHHLQQLVDLWTLSEILTISVVD